MKHYVCLVSVEWKRESYIRGDIAITDPEEVPPAVVFASFVPPEGLAGTPVLGHLEDPGTGDLVFKYQIEETKTRFVLKARIGIPIATLTVVTDSDGVHPQPADHAAPLDAATTNLRALVRWGKCQPEPLATGDWDALRWGLGEDS